VTDRTEQAQMRAAASRLDVPFRLDLEQQRKRAKALLQAFRAGDETAYRRFRRHQPALWKGSEAVARSAKLSDAQLVIARELGLPSWPQLKAHILRMREMLEHIERGGSAPDREMGTLHIRCGSDIRSRLSEAGFVGDFLEYSDALCQGPVLDDPSWLDRRADFLAQGYGAGVGRSREQIAEGLGRAEADLAGAASRYDRVVLWFEHDSYDQINLARCLSQFAETPPRCLEMVTLDHYPGGMRFIGLGQLPPEALRLLWQERRPVTQLQALEGSTAWTLFRQPDPTPLAVATRTAFVELPYLRRALRRHCQELPWVGDGLSLTERLILELLAERPRTSGEIFRDLMQDREPLPWLGDLMLRSIVENMKLAARPVFSAAFDGKDRRWFREGLTITPLGRAILAGAEDWLSLAPPERWLGGVCIRADVACWRWDDRSGTTVLR
jgi:hypothetical protein